jgi:hypothetical protein
MPNGQKAKRKLEDRKGRVASRKDHVDRKDHVTAT